MMPKHSPKRSDSADQLRAQLEAVQQQLSQAQEKERRALADYQNVVRRNQEERLKLIQMANRELAEALLQPLEHLELAVSQFQDPGLSMALEQLKKTLQGFGLEEIEVLGKPFDVNTMEAVEGSQGKIVKQVVRKGYFLNGKVLQHAKVIVG